MPYVEKATYNAQGNTMNQNICENKFAKLLSCVHTTLNLRRQMWSFLEHFANIGVSFVFIVCNSFAQPITKTNSYTTSSSNSKA